MKVPNPQAKNEIDNIQGAYIRNPYAGKDLLTQQEAIDTISRLSGMLLADIRYRQALPRGDIKIGG